MKYIHNIYISYYKPDQYKYVIDLLLISQLLNGIIVNSHYVLIKNLNSFLNFKFGTTRQYYCPY